MEEKLVKIYSYQLDRQIIDKCIEEERNIKSADVEIAIQQILKDNNIQYKNKINEVWSGNYKTPRYDLQVEIYVNMNDEEKTKKLIEKYLNK